MIEAEARQDVAGDNGFLGTLRLRYGSPLGERWRLDASVGTSWASEDYMSSYFGIDAGDAARSGLGQYNADESFKDVTRRSLAELSLPRKLERDGDWLVYPPDRRRRRQPGGRRRRRRQPILRRCLNQPSVLKGRTPMQTLRSRRASRTTAMRSLAHAAAVAALLVAMTGLAPRTGAAQTPGPDVTAAMQGELGDQVLDGCNTELARFCAEVAPGEGRLLACLYAHGDKLTRRCDYALYNAAARLERAIGAMTYVVSECRAELERHCAGVDVGEGRVVQCLKDHASELSPGCDQALTEVGVQ